MPHELLTASQDDPDRLTRRQLFQAMSTGDDYVADAILHFNGGLFPDADVAGSCAGRWLAHSRAGVSKTI